MGGGGGERRSVELRSDWVKGNLVDGRARTGIDDPRAVTLQASDDGLYSGKLQKLLDSGYLVGRSVVET